MLGALDSNQLNLPLIIQMSDLSNLFKSPPPSPQTLTSSPISLSTRTPSRSLRDSWNIGSMESSIRKGLRKQVGAETMLEQLKIFSEMQKESFLKKIGIIGAAAFFLYLVSSIDGSVLFAFLLLIAAELSSGLILPFNDPTMMSSISRVQPLLYCSIFYSLLKWGASISNRQIHWPLTFISIVATFAHFILQFYKAFLLISTRNIIAQALKYKKWIDKLWLFPKYLIYRGKMVLEISKYLTIAVSMAAMGLALIFLYFNQLSIEVLQPNFLLLSLLIFIGLQVFLDAVTFINLTVTQDLKLSKIAKDKIPISLSLLRLQPKPFNRLVQLECLKSIYLKVYQSQGFLTTQTTKSLLYNTYMDIFNQFASNQLERVITAIMQFIAKAKENDKTISLEKTLLQDLFVYFRKLTAFLLSQWQAIRVMDLLCSLSFLFLIITKVQNESEDEEIRISGRIISLVKDIKLRLQECTDRISLSSYTRGELVGFYNSFSLYESQIQSDPL